MMFCDVTFCAMMGLVLRAMPFHFTISIDEKLLERLNNQKTREVAFGEFYDVLSRHVYMYALRMTSCPSEASDITQETFIRVHSHLCRERSYRVRCAGPNHEASKSISDKCFESILGKGQLKTMLDGRRRKAVSNNHVDRFIS
jgi:hypothetical protein